MKKYIGVILMISATSLFAAEGRGTGSQRSNSTPPYSYLYAIRLGNLVGVMNLLPQALEILGDVDVRIMETGDLEGRDSAQAVRDYQEIVAILAQSFGSFTTDQNQEICFARASYRHLRAVVLERLAALSKDAQEKAGYLAEALSENRLALHDWLTDIPTGGAENEGHFLVSEIARLRQVGSENTATPLLGRLRTLMHIREELEMSTLTAQIIAEIEEWLSTVEACDIAPALRTVSTFNSVDKFAKINKISDELKGHMLLLNAYIMERAARRNGDQSFERPAHAQMCYGSALNNMRKAYLLTTDDALRVEMERDLFRLGALNLAQDLLIKNNPTYRFLLDMQILREKVQGEEARAWRDLTK